MTLTKSESELSLASLVRAILDQELAPLSYAKIVVAVTASSPPQRHAQG